MVVELEDYIRVAEAPINSKNGEAIISEARKIAPSKPIKYFIFAHHHPHYLGGLRAFVHKDATILCTDISQPYVKYIANEPHSLKPDSLQLEPKKHKTQVISDSLILGKESQMKIYFIGRKSAHTKDFLIYYFS
jgi:flavorubredoxin